MTVIYGEVDWSDDSLDFGADRNSLNKDLFMRLSDGDNELRLITSPFQYLVHKYKKDPNNPKDYGKKIMCSSPEGRCPLCELGDKQKQRWFFGVIDRKTNTTKILDVGPGVMQHLKKLARNPKFGDPTKYDINIVVDEKGGPANYYTVQAYPKEPLSAEDQQKRDMFNVDDLKRRVTPPSYEKVKEMLDKINADSNVSTVPQSREFRAKSQTLASSVTNDDDLDEAFPAYNGNA
jgi:hypothetical protein